MRATEEPQIRTRERSANVALGETGLVRAGFSLLVLAGLWLTYVGWRAAPAQAMR